MSRSHLLVFDHGTTSIRACIMDGSGAIIARAQQGFEQIYPQPGWVEHDPKTLWEFTLQVAQAALTTAGLGWENIAATGLTNQRETVILWDRQTGKPVHNAIVWQCRRTAEACELLKQNGHAAMIQQKTGLVIDAYFSASKIQWLLRNVPECQTLLADNRLLFGTVDTYILWRLSGGKCHVTDMTNASRTMLYNIHQREWDADLLALFDIPRTLLPEVIPSNQRFGVMDLALTGGIEVPLAGIAGDQQAALHGQKCWMPGTAKSTYGTGAFLVMNTGQTPVHSAQGLLTTLATDAEGQPAYALEGAIFFAGAALEWLSKKLDVIEDMREVDTLAGSIPHNEGVYLVPAFAGLGAPYWDANARGAVFGITQDTGKAHLVRAALESMAYQTKAVLDAMQVEAGLSLETLRVDGGVTRSNVLVQFLADMLNVPVERADDPELTAKGAGYLAGLAVGFWQNPEEIKQLAEQTERFEPAMSAPERARLMQGWQQAVNRVLS
ncbi:glycerol kinase GlpK [Vampirovibrio sp.]|uniref:glycerol kinase GlpK n=1 Tax=Vampirovibrio sp. TaxID=2717857 RepID=UPI0035936CB6